MIWAYVVIDQIVADVRWDYGKSHLANEWWWKSRETRTDIQNISNAQLPRLKLKHNHNSNHIDDGGHKLLKVSVASSC